VFLISIKFLAKTLHGRLTYFRPPDKEPMPEGLKFCWGTYFYRWSPVDPR